MKTTTNAAICATLAAAPYLSAWAQQQGAPDPALVRSYDSVNSERRLYLRDDERRLKTAFDAGVAGDPAQREQAEKVLRAAEQEQRASYRMRMSRMSRESREAV
jgi:hypothetical protein